MLSFAIKKVFRKLHTNPHPISQACTKRGPSQGLAEQVLSERQPVSVFWAPSGGKSQAYLCLTHPCPCQTLEGKGHRALPFPTGFGLWGAEASLLVKGPPLLPGSWWQAGSVRGSGVG